MQQFNATKAPCIKHAGESFSRLKSLLRGKLVLFTACTALVLSGCGGSSAPAASASAVLAALTVTNASVVEGNAGTTNLVFTVTSNIAATSAIAVAYTTVDGTATAGSDYTATNGTLNIAAGATSGTVSVPVLGDTTIEPDETFTLVLTAPANATVTGGTITGTITNDDFPTVSIADTSVLEGSTLATTNMDFTVTLSAASPVNVAVDYATSDGTALSASDYTPTTATLTIAAGATTGTITVSVGADATFEPNETLTLTLSNSIAATLGTAVATGTILNDDAGGLNDTGITTWGNATLNNLTVTQPLFPGQDADHGRDAQAAAGTLIKTGGGKAGFDFTKLDTAGQPLANQAASYAITPWSCVQDHVTGLMWEVKTIAGPAGLRDANHTYTWLNTTGVNDGGNAGTANGGACLSFALNCDTESYVAAVNGPGLCGFNDWRLPKVESLRSITDLSIAPPGPTIDTGYFPNTAGGFYWSASPFAGSATSAWVVNFGDGVVKASSKATNNSVRLVRGGQ